MTFIPSATEDSEKISLDKFDGTSFPKYNSTQINDNIEKICFLDLETTGLNKDQDKIIEIALKLGAINKTSGDLLGVISNYQSFQDPEFLIDERITMINGINNHMVKDQSIDWIRVKEIVNDSDIIVAHNAAFDRGFMDQALDISKEKIWSCSIGDIDWLKRGFSSSKQELLCIWHGFYYDSHRAMFDVNALIALLTHDSYNENKPIIELIENSQKPLHKLLALHSPFESKDQLRNNKYKWDPEKKCWWKYLKSEEIESEKQWLADNVYNGQFEGIVQIVLPEEKYN